MAFKHTRITESRNKLKEAFLVAMGSYIEQEATKDDLWRDQSIGQLYAHLSHEIEEIRRNIGRDELDYLAHNAIDAVLLSTMLLAITLETGERKEMDKVRNV